MAWQLIVLAFIAYLIGSINLSIILSKIMGKGDIREHGSGNAGTTNTLRVLGKLPALGVLIFDILKAVIAVYIGKWIISIGDTSELTKNIGIATSAIFAVLGHNFPIYYGFKGGKGIATSLGAILVVDWQIGLTCLVFALVIIIASRMVSLGSISAAVLFPVLVLMNDTTSSLFTIKWVFLCFSILLALIAIFRHKSNIKRLLNGTENKLWKTKAEKANLK